MVTLRWDLYVPVNRIIGPPNFFSDTLRALHNGISDRNWDYSLIIIAIVRSEFHQEKLVRGSGGALRGYQPTVLSRRTGHSLPTL